MVRGSGLDQADLKPRPLGWPVLPVAGPRLGRAAAQAEERGKRGLPFVHATEGSSYVQTR